MVVDLVLHREPDPEAEAEGLAQRLARRRFAMRYADAPAAYEAALGQVARVLPRARLLRVREAGGPERGHVWLVEQPGGEDLAVADLVLDDHLLAGPVRELVVGLARSEGYRRLTLGVPPLEPVLEGFERGGGFALTARQLWLDLALDLDLDLDRRPPVEDGLVLDPMDPTSYAAWEAGEVESYAAELEAAGASAEVALERSQAEQDELLPDGLSTAGQHFFVLRVDGSRVGSLWLATTEPMAYVYDLLVDPAHRRLGHGAAAMRAAARWARAHGAHAIGLNVFGHNASARALYDRLGYGVVETFLALDLQP